MILRPLPHLIRKMVTPRRKKDKKTPKSAKKATPKVKKKAVTKSPKEKSPKVKEESPSITKDSKIREKGDTQSKEKSRYKVTQREIPKSKRGVPEYHKRLQNPRKRRHPK